MEVLSHAAEKIEEFNSYADRPRESYHQVLTARAGQTLVLENGNISDAHLYLIDWALRSYFMMNRGNRMGNTEEFVNRLRNKLMDNEINSILIRLRDVSITALNLHDYQLDMEKLYESLSNCERGLSVDGTYFRVGATKVMHCLFPELFVMLDQNVGKAVGYRAGQYNNFQSYWHVMDICREELTEWEGIYGTTDTLPLPRIFDKCASIMGIRRA